MTMSDVLKAVRARGGAAAPHTLHYMAATGRLSPPPRLDSSHRRVYEPAHVDQVLAHVRRGAKKAG